MHVVSDPVSERSGKSFLAENEGVPGRGHEAEKWLVETELASITRRAILYSTNGGQIVAKMLELFSENYFTKMMISRDPVDRFC